MGSDGAHACADRGTLVRPAPGPSLKFGFDFSNAEIASILGKNEGAVKALQHRALGSLERQLVR